MTQGAQLHSGAITRCINDSYLQARYEITKDRLPLWIAHGKGISMIEALWVANQTAPTFSACAQNHLDDLADLLAVATLA